jgi:nucleotide-binding universal stress UspA family protein
MNTFRRWMVGLDNSLMDKTAIQYTAFLAKVLRPEKIYFINVQKNLEVPDSVKEKFPELRQPLDEKIKDALKDEVQKNFTNHDHFDIEYKVIEGNPFEELLHWIEIKNIDLLIVGRKKELKGSGVLPQKLIRKSSCSALFIPEKPNFRLEEIFVPLDFSEHSESAFEFALNLAKHDEATTLHLQHIYHIPYGYSQTRLEKDYSTALKEEATEQYNEMISKFDIDNAHLSPIFHYDNQDRVAEIICETAHKRNADIIVLGAKGRNAFIAQMLGSVTEKILKTENSIPVMVVIGNRSGNGRKKSVAAQLEK